MKKILFLSLTFYTLLTFGQAGTTILTPQSGKVGGSLLVGSSSDNLTPSAILQAKSTTKGFLPPCLTTTQRNAIASPAKGLMIYNTTDSVCNYYDGAQWRPCSVKTNANGSVNNLQINDSLSLHAVNFPSTLKTDANGLVYGDTVTGIDSLLPYYKYVALLNQDSTDAPIVTVLENTLGDTLIWSRGGFGVIQVFSNAGVFTNSKTVSFITASMSGYIYFRQADSDENNMVWIKEVGGAPTDGLQNTSIEIRVYK